MIGLVVGAGLLVAAGVYRQFNPGHHVAVDALPAGWLFMVAGLMAGAAACWFGVSRRPVRWFATVAILVVAAAFGVFAGMMNSLRDEPSESRRVGSPDGRMALVFLSRSATFAPDIVYEYRVRTNAGLASREWAIGCVNSDIDAPPSRVEWSGANTVLAEFGPPGRGSVRITLDPGTGRPDRTFGGGC
ncbi:hypothetical protein EV193_10876 [Herbihabitans rhizosphaerae]|uniref:Uncharacterized protein n=1 Tax=Herbihabitans rhizosphaerae TaxID=1872711 RepID=A0A4Q7KIH8_9PSEU|nr:hypothetical protein EV193_10876 [Herbihabitans rhizosphaerae]